VTGGAPRQVLSLADAPAGVVGVIVGAGRYQVAPAGARGAGSAPATLGLWLLGGALSLCGALVYAELASALPHEGGDYVYLSRAYGPAAGFLFGWIQVLVVRPGDIAVMAFAFASYLQAAGLGAGLDPRLPAVAAVLVLTGLNARSVEAGKWTQNALTLAKVLGLGAVVAVAVVGPGRATALAVPAPAAVGEAGAVPLRVALILILFAYGGWNEMAYVAAEMRRPQRDIARALVLGTLTVTALYLLANGSFLRVLGHAGLAGSPAAAADAVSAACPGRGARLVSALVCVSALGAVGGLVFTGARISYAVGLDHRLFRGLGRWHDRAGVPLRALGAQAALACGLIVVFGSFLDTVLYTAAAVYLFYLATSHAVLVLRRRETGLARPFRLPGYPVPVLVFAITCLLLIHAAVAYRPLVAAGSLGVIALGWPAYRWSRRTGPRLRGSDGAAAHGKPGSSASPAGR